MASVIGTIRLYGDFTKDEWREACEKAYERLKLDPRCDEESIRQPELVDGTERSATYQITCDTLAGDVLKILIFANAWTPVHRRRNVVR